MKFNPYKSDIDAFIAAQSRKSKIKRILDIGAIVMLIVATIGVLMCIFTG